MESNWKQKSIENLEKDYWGLAPKNAASLVEKVYTLRTKSIENLNPSDIRLLISQQVGLNFLIP